MTGIIEKRTEHVTNDGAKYLRLKIGDLFYTLWSSSLFDVAQEGLQVEFMSTEKPSGNGNGQVFRNINSLTPIATPAAPKPQPASNNSTSKDLQISRMSCLKTAMDFFRLQAREHTPTIDEVIDMADEFVDYVAHGRPQG